MNIQETYISYTRIFDNRFALQKNAEIDIEKEYEVLNTYYYDFNGTRLDINKEENRDILFNFANENFRYILLNQLIGESLSIFINHNGFVEKELYENLDTIMDIVDERVKTLYHLKNIETKEIKPLPKENIPDYFRRFLGNIDKRGELVYLYDDMLNKGNIIYLDELNDVEKDKLFKKLGIDKVYENFFAVDKDLEPKIFLTRKGDMLDFRKLAHEFTHYVVYAKNKDNMEDFSIIFRELPSSFYEIEALRFLGNYGYTNEDIRNANADKLKYIYDIGVDLSLINSYIKIFLGNNFKVSEKLDYHYRRNQLYDFVEANGEEAYNDLVKTNPLFADTNDMAKSYCDTVNKSLYNCPTLLNELYPYVIANHYAIKVLKREDENILNFMKRVTYNLPKVTYKGFTDVLVHHPCNKAKKKTS